MTPRDVGNADFARSKNLPMPSPCARGTCTSMCNTANQSAPRFEPLRFLALFLCSLCVLCGPNSSISFSRVPGPGTTAHRDCRVDLRQWRFSLSDCLWQDHEKSRNTSSLPQSPGRSEERSVGKEG